jgi:hypothetical protein
MDARSADTVRYLGERIKELEQKHQDALVAYQGTAMEIEKQDSEIGHLESYIATLEAERNAYREVAIRLIKFGSGYELDDTLAEIGEKLDAEAQKLLSEQTSEQGERKGEKK